MVIWKFLDTAFLWDGMKTDLFQSCGHCWVFETCWHVEVSTLTASSFRIWSSLAGIPSPPLTLFIVILPKTHLTPKCLALGEWSHHSIYLGYWDLFCIVLCILATSSLSLLLLLGPYCFCPFLCPYLDEVFPWYLQFSSFFFFFLSSVFIRRSLVFPILLFPSISLHWLLSMPFKKISPCYFLELCIQMVCLIFCFTFHFSSFLSYL